MVVQRARVSTDEALGWVGAVFAIIAFGFELVAITAAMFRPDSLTIIAVSATAAVISLIAGVWIADS